MEAKEDPKRIWGQKEVEIVLLKNFYGGADLGEKAGAGGETSGWIWAELMSYGPGVSKSTWYRNRPKVSQKDEDLKERVLAVVKEHPT